MNTAREGSGANGVSTSAIAAAGITGNPGIGFPTTNVVESWNGTSWTEVSEVNTSRSYAGGGGTSNTSAVIFGGGQPIPSNGAKTEAWNGSAWTEVNDLALGRDTYANGAGSASNAITAGGYNGGQSPTNVANTEEWAFSGLPPSTPAAGNSDAIIGQM